MTNSNGQMPYAAALDTLGAIIGLASLFALVVMLWRIPVHANALVIVAASSGWLPAAFLSRRLSRQAVKQRDERDRRYEQARAVKDAIGGRPTRLIGDAERDVVLAELATAFEAGRLRLDEHAERSGAAQEARTAEDLRDTLRGLL